MVMIINNGRWCFGLSGENPAYPEHLKIWLGNLDHGELRVHMLTRWLVAHDVRGFAWIGDDVPWSDFKSRRIVRQFNRQMARAGMQCSAKEIGDGIGNI
ncbi:hypothetical protein DXD54_08315 [Clostridium sp. TM06-18]|nr:hypothetical protein [Clostridium sp. TM06-18]RHU37184.1 hypothetical protein DXD54_08315 [Clostridium sp. TM06-18]